MKRIWNTWNQLGLVKQICLGLIVGVILALIVPKAAASLTILGDIFIGALKAVAPILVLFLVMSAIAQHKSGKRTNMKSILVLYLFGTFMAGLTAVLVSFIFPVTLELTGNAESLDAPSGVAEVLKTLVLNIVDNPISALMNANYIGILAWAIVLGLALKGASKTTKTALLNISDGVTTVVTWVIKLAPFGIMGLVIDSITTSGLATLMDYGRLIMVLVATMVFIALVVNPLIVYVCTRKNPYPLVFACLRESGITAFFTRSSAANIPVNMQVCEKLGLNRDTYSVSIPLGGTINMAGAAVTISVLTLAAVHTMNIPVDLLTAVILSVLAAVCACGASGVSGGSLLLIPLACSLFGISDDIAMQVVGIGFIVGVIQDSCETGLNSSTDVLFTAAAEYREKRINKETKDLNNLGEIS